MEALKDNYTKLTNKLDKSHAPLKAVWFALELYDEIQKNKLMKNEQTRLIELWENYIESKNWGNLANGRIDYAVHLAEYPSDFIFEDMYKLAVTLQEIEVLRVLGIAPDKDNYDLLKYSVEKRFLQQESLAKYTINNLTRLGGDAEWWFYSAI